MFVNTGFSYDHVSGDEMYGLMVVRTGGGIIEQNFGIEREPIIDEIKYKSRKYFYRNKSNVYSFTVQFAKSGIWTYEQRAEISRWLYPNKYKDFTTDDFPLVFKCMARSAKFYNASSNYGYLDVTFDCDQAYAYSPLADSEIYDLSSNTVSGTFITEFNKSNVPDYYYYCPIIEIVMVDDTAVSLTNTSNGGKIFGFTGLTKGEIINIDGETGRITSNTSDNRYANLTNTNFFELVYGANRINVKGKVKIQFRYQYPMMI